MTTDRARRAHWSAWLVSALVVLGASASVAATELARRARRPEPVAARPPQTAASIPGLKPAPASRRQVVVVRRSRAS